MAKDKSKSGPKAPGKIPKEIAGIRIPKALRSSGKAALKLAQTPAARELLSAGLLAAAAAVTANTRTRKAARDGVADASETVAEATSRAAESAGKIGAAFVGAAADAAQRMFGNLAPSDGGAGDTKAAPVANEDAPEARVADLGEEPDAKGDAPAVPRKPPVKRTRNSTDGVVKTAGARRAKPPAAAKPS